MCNQACNSCNWVCVDCNDLGEVAERLMAPVLKTGIPGRVSGVRIPPSPPDIYSTELAQELHGLT
jgi:hypothetical protein